jgi:hypothetical protein
MAVDVNVPPHRQVWEVLVDECGASDDRVQFAEFEHHWPACREFRFQGALGFGGKVWASRGRVYVTCYPEHENTRRHEMIERANARLAEL